MVSLLVYRRGGKLHANRSIVWPPRTPPRNGGGRPLHSPAAHACLGSPSGRIRPGGGFHATRTVEQILETTMLDYAAIYRGASEWRILPAIDHPSEPARCVVSGTGL